MTTKVTPEVETSIMELARTLTTASAITDAVNAKLGTTLSRRTVAVVLERTRGERADIAKNVAREILTPQVAGDLDILRDHRDRLHRLALRAGARAEKRESGSEDAEYRKAVAALTAVVDKRLHYSGADTPDAPADELKAATQRLHGRLDRLASAARAEGEAPGDSPDRR